MLSTHRVFFAIELSPETKTSLLSYQDRIDIFSAAKIDAANFHITLSFLGSVSSRKVELILDQFEPFSFNDFDCKIGNPIYFNNAKTLALEVVSGISQLKQLKISIEQQLKNLAHFDLGKHTFKPHISLFRQVEQPIDAIPSYKQTFRIESFCLMESTPTKRHVKYDVIKEWRLYKKKSIKEQLIGTD